MNNVYDDISAFNVALIPDRPLIGLDLGSKTIGVAVSDTRRVIASPLLTLAKKKFRENANKVLAIVGDRNATGLVIGLPRNMNGSEGPGCQSSRAFASNIAVLTDLPITYWDERLSTVEAERSLLSMDETRKRRSKTINHVAASLILQGALDRLQNIGRTN